MRKRLRDLNLRQITVRIFSDEYVIAEGFPTWQEAQQIAFRTMTEAEIAAGEFAATVTEVAERPIVSARGASVEDALMGLYRAEETK